MREIYKIQEELENRDYNPIIVGAAIDYVERYQNGENVSIKEVAQDNGAHYKRLRHALDDVGF